MTLPHARLFAWLRPNLRSLADLRDATLVVAGVCYGVGIVMWSVHAWIHNLGLLPGLQFQYLIAGAVPVLFLVVLYAAAVALFGLRRRVGAWLAGSGVGARWTRLCVLAACALAFFGFVVSGFDWVERLAPSAAERVRTPALLTAFVLGFFLPQSTAGATGDGSFGDMMRRMSGAYAVFVAFVLALGLPAIFVADLYPRIPQALGGVAPRAAAVEIAADAVPGSLLESLPHVQPTDGLIEIEVEIYFQNERMLLVKRPGERRQFRTPTYEIARRGVRAITWRR